MTIDMEQFKTTYIEESHEGLEVMESKLLEMDAGETDEDAINSIFRAAHSIKGGGATFGFSDISNFTHVVETLLDEIRNGERVINQEAIDLFLTSVDVIREMLTAAQKGEAIDEARASDVKQQLEKMLGTQADDPATLVETQANPNNVGWDIHFIPFPEMLTRGNDVVRMFRELGELGAFDVQADLAKLPTLKDLNPEECHIGWKITLTGSVLRDQIDEIFAWVEGDCELIITPLADTKPTKQDAKRQSQAKQPPVKVTAAAERRVGAGAESSSIRVDIEKIDALINMVGELVITQSMLSQLGEDFDMGRCEKLLKGLGQLERNTRELQESVMRIRMIPISFAFNRFPRMIHDMCGKFGKKVVLKLSGESTELDKTVMEKIGDPLVHLVRNSLDHGIEMPEQRVAAGKPESGTVHLNAFHQGGNIVIEITDDGAGLDKDKIFAKAVEKGLVEASTVLSDDKIYDLLFQPGFSTAEQVTDISGRGVGMDVVKRNILALGGSVEVATELGCCTTFTIRLPLTLAILDGQLICVGDETYIIPLISIIESLQVDKKSVSAIAGKAELYKLREEYIPIIRFHHVFGVHTEKISLENGLLVVVEGNGYKAALLVDDLLGQQQVVIKSLETNFRKIDGVSGATILGDGTVALILDVAGLIRVAQSGKHQHPLNTIENDGVAA
ncbi:MAG: chemotaxis protein CheA [Gammaproteobacteria bacterium]|nr:chemotaxis protein CheA [Gammaproteobacteria bacterium]